MIYGLSLYLYKEIITQFSTCMTNSSKSLGWVHISRLSVPYQNGRKPKLSQKEEGENEFVLITIVYYSHPLW